MRSIRIIAKRELAQYFTSPIAYMVAFAVLVLTSFLFNSDLSERAGRAAMNGTAVINSFGFFTVFFAPMLTMRLFAEESREGTLELMLTMPVRDSDIVLGKFLGAWAYYSLILCLTLIYQGILLSITNFSGIAYNQHVDIGPIITSYMGIWLFGGATLAVGILFSAMTENQVIAGFMSTATLFILWLGDYAGQVIQNRPAAEVIRTLSLQAHYSTSFLVGVIRFEDIVFFAGLMAAMLFITIRLIESRRWR
jgi:ABC-2 type transport system permease protein